MPSEVKKKIVNFFLIPAEKEIYLEFIQNYRKIYHTNAQSNIKFSFS
jgi:hypothetical protein